MHENYMGAYHITWGNEGKYELVSCFQYLIPFLVCVLFPFLDSRCFCVHITGYLNLNLYIRIELSFILI